MPASIVYRVKTRGSVESQELDLEECLPLKTIKRRTESEASLPATSKTYSRNHVVSEGRVNTFAEYLSSDLP